MTIVNEQVDSELEKQAAEHERKIEMKPGAVPSSAQSLGLQDNDENILYAVTCVKEDVNDYIKVLKKGGFFAQQFDYDLNAHNQKQYDRK